MQTSSKTALLAGTVILIAVVLAIVRIMVRETIQFVEISSILVVIILVLAWLVTRSRKPAVNKP